MFFFSYRSFIFIDEMIANKVNIFISLAEYEEWRNKKSTVEMSEDWRNEDDRLWFFVLYHQRNPIIKYG